jgi:hypothetical protein
MKPELTSYTESVEDNTKNQCNADSVNEDYVLPSVGEFRRGDKLQLMSLTIFLRIFTLPIIRLIQSPKKTYKVILVTM